MVAQYAYTPWGELESAAQAFDSVGTLRWKGLPYDAETGFYAMDIEFKFDGPPGEEPALQVKQCRPHPGWGL